MIDVRVAGDEHHVHAIPAPRRNLPGREGREF